MFNLLWVYGLRVRWQVFAFAGLVLLAIVVLSGCNSRIHPAADAQQKASGREVSQVVIGDPSAEIQKYTGSGLQQKPKPIAKESY